MISNSVREKVVALLEGGMGPSAIVKKLGVSRTSIYRIKDKLKKGKPATPLPPSTEPVVIKAVKLVPNPRLFLGEVDGRLVRVVKKEGQNIRPGAMLRGQQVENDLFRLV